MGLLYHHRHRHYVKKLVGFDGFGEQLCYRRRPCRCRRQYRVASLICFEKLVSLILQKPDLDVSQQTFAAYSIMHLSLYPD